MVLLKADPDTWYDIGLTSGIFLIKKK